MESNIPVTIINSTPVDSVTIDSPVGGESSGTTSVLEISPLEAKFPSGDAKVLHLPVDIAPLAVDDPKVLLVPSGDDGSAPLENPPKAESKIIKAITPESLEFLRSTINRNMGNLIFRRVAHVVAKKEHLIEHVITSPVDGIPLSTIRKPGGSTSPSFTPKEYEQNVEERYSRFYFLTSDVAIRNNDRHGKVALFGASNKYSQIDIAGVKMDFRFSYASGDRINQVPPRVGDLVCGIVGKDKHGRPNPAFNFWFTCSDQFLHAWTAIRYSEHETLDKLVTTRETDETDHEAEIRKALFRGNKLCTNSYRKWIRANLECGVFGNNLVPGLDETQQAEAEKRYYTLRTERTSVEWVHVYAALVLMLRYREVPSPQNIPVILGVAGATVPTPKTWDLPEGWIDRFINKYGLEQTDEVRKAYIPHHRQSPRDLVLEDEVAGDVEGETPTGSGVASSAPIPIKRGSFQTSRRHKVTSPTPTNSPQTPSPTKPSRLAFSPKLRTGTEVPKPRTGTELPKTTPPWRALKGNAQVSYSKVEFDDNLFLSALTTGLKAPKKATKINQLEFPPISGSSPSSGNYMPIGAWADEVETEVEELEVETQVEDEVGVEDGEVEEVGEDDEESEMVED